MNGKTLSSQESDLKHVDVSFEHTPLDKIPVVVETARAKFNSGVLSNVEDRKNVLRALLKMLKENEEPILAALQQDIGRVPNESRMMEHIIMMNEIAYLLNNVESFMKPTSLPTAHPLQECHLKSDPKGVVLVISTWNYPISMALQPTVGAIAAGNTVVIKPSEGAPAVAMLLTKLLPQYVPEGVIGVVNGAVEEVKLVLEQRFDHILFTGASSIGRSVMQAASKHLTPVTLELGGKSPVVVDSSCKNDLETVAARVAWGKFVNCGQICVAPDYVLVHESLKDKFVEAFTKARTRFMGSDPLNCADYAHIINERHWDRVDQLLTGGQVLVGGEKDKSRLKICPTLMGDVKLNHPLMTDEIFGPLLPLIPYDTTDKAIEFIKAREKPLALYVFSNDDNMKKRFERETSSGSLVFNDVVLQVGLTNVPFGGVGCSGMGNYHGRYSFDTFSHKKTVLSESFTVERFSNVRYPPYTAKNLSWYRFMVESSKEKGCCCM